MQWLVWIGSHNLNEELEIIAYWQIILEVNFQPCMYRLLFIRLIFSRLIGQVNLLYNNWSNMIKKIEQQK